MPVKGAAEPLGKGGPATGYLPTGMVRNRVTGEVVRWDDPKVQNPLIGANVPNTTWQDTNVNEPQGYPSHTVSDIRQSLADFGLPVDTNQTGPLTAQEVQLWRTF